LIQPATRQFAIKWRYFLEFPLPAVLFTRLPDGGNAASFEQF
jgi:hypothetical protein